MTNEQTDHRSAAVPVTNVLRVIHDVPRPGAWNMAVDEVLLRTAAEAGQATLRFYSWSEPTLSLGYFQAAADRHCHPSSLDCHVVRRDTGGGAILHDQELTYSIALPQRLTPGWPVSRLYEICHQTLIAALAGVGVSAHLARERQGCTAPGSKPHEDKDAFLCFLRRSCYDVVIGEAKIAGSAQRRRQGAVLQHGSILLGRSRFAPELPGIRDLTGAQLTVEVLTAAWEPHLLAALKLPFIEGVLTPREVEQAETICRTRFQSAEHLGRR